VLRNHCLWLSTPSQRSDRSPVSRSMGSTILHLSWCEIDHLLPHYVEAKNAGGLPHVVVSMYTVSETFTVRTKGQRFLVRSLFIVKSNYVFVISVHPPVCTHETTRFILEELEWNSTGSQYWFLIKIVGMFQLCLNSDKSNRRFTWRPTPLLTDAYEGRCYDTYLFSISQRHE
jgi:hypothetical protein